MKKISLLISFVLMIQFFSACSGKEEEFQTPVNFYYCNEEISYNSPAGVIQAETREGYAFHGSVTAFLHAYLQGPLSSDLQRLIPADTELIFLEIDGDTVYLEFSQQFSKLSGAKLMTACSAMLMSLHEFSGAQVLNVRVEDSLLDEKEEFVISMDDIVLMDAVSTQE